MDKKWDWDFNTNQNFKIYDLSPTLRSSLAVFPGDTPFTRQVQLDFALGHNLLLSSIQSTLHIGAHTDAPNHYHPQGEGIAQRSLHYYLGPCQVVSITSSHPSGRLYPEDWTKNEFGKPKAPRVLFKTNSFPDPDRWNSDFNSLSPELIEWLSEQGVILVGIDTPSVDPCSSKDLETHQMIYRKQMAILEGIIVTEIPDGVYILVALPLKIENGDASPVRAILIAKDKG